MALRVSAATGNWSAAGTWLTSDATGYLNSETGNTALTTSYVESATFTPGAITVAGICVKIASRALSPTGTISVRLAVAGVLVSGTEVTIDVADLPYCTTSTLEGGWVHFKFATPVLLLAATNYTVSAKTSSATQVNLFRNSTAGNWSRILVTTTTGAPAAGDDIVVIGDRTAAGAGSAYVVTYNITASTDFGSGTTGTTNGPVNPGLAIGQGGTLTWATTAATDFLMVMSGCIVIYRGGVENKGTAGTPCPRGSTMVTRFDCGADGDFGRIVRNGATFTAQGLSRTSGKNIWKCKLNTDEAVNSTSLGVDTDTGWLDNDQFAITSTDQTATNCEQGLLNGNAGASSLTVDGMGGAGGGLASAKSGTAPTQATIILLTRSVREEGPSSSLMAWSQYTSEATIDADWAEWRYMGKSTGGFPSLDFQNPTSPGSVALHYCVVHNGEGWGLRIATGGAFTIDHFGMAFQGISEASQVAMRVDATTTGSPYLNDVVAIRVYTAGSGAIICSGFQTGTLTNILCCGASGNGFSWGTGTTVPLVTGTVGPFEGHSNGGLGVNFANNSLYGRVAGLTRAWRNGGGGIAFVASGTAEAYFDALEMFGNVSSNLAISGNGGTLTIGTIHSSGDTTFATTNGLVLGGPSLCTITINGGDFSPSGSIWADHTTDIVTPPATNRSSNDIILNDVGLGGTTPVGSTLGFAAGFGVKATRLDHTDGNNRTWQRACRTLANSSTVYGSNTFSEEGQPLSATAKGSIGLTVVPIDDGASKTVTFQVRKDSSYNGNAPRLMLKANGAMGVAVDTVLDTLTVGVDTWEALSAAIGPSPINGAYQVYVDFDGTAGSVFVGNREAA